jgi:linker histone H1 and H5 family
MCLFSALLWGAHFQNQRKASNQRFPSSNQATMTTLALIKEAIVALKDRTGSSVPAINKWIETEKKVCGS